jgi:hypothetical protein
MVSELKFDVTQLENLRTLYEHEEKLRIDSLRLLSVDPESAELLFLVANSMGVIFGFSHDHVAKHENELIIQYMGIRLFNSAATSIKLALGGYPQNAFSHIRDIVEVAHLVDFFFTFPDRILEWKTSDKKARIKKFGPGKIRLALNQRDKETDDKRKEVFDALSEIATHVSYSGFVLVNNEGMGQLGPFVDEKKLRAWLEEIALRLVPAAILLGKHFPLAPEQVLALSKGFESQAADWVTRRIQKKFL